MGCANRRRASERGHGICANEFDPTDLSADHDDTEYVATGGSVRYSFAKRSLWHGQRDRIASEHNVYHRERSSNYVAADNTSTNVISGYIAARCGTRPDFEPSELRSTGNDDLHDDDANHCTAVVPTG